MANGFRIWSSSAYGRPPLRQSYGKSAQQYTYAQLLKYSNGLPIPVSAQTDKAQLVFSHMVTPTSALRPSTVNLTTATGDEKIEGLYCAGNHSIWETDLTGTDAPVINKVAVNSGSTTTALVTAAGSTSDNIGGTIAFPTLGFQGYITGDTVSGGVHTFTFSPPAPRAIGSSDTAIVVPFSPSSFAVKLASTNPDQGISTAVADNTGGNVQIENVDLLHLPGPVVRVKFPYFS